MSTVTIGGNGDLIFTQHEGISTPLKPPLIPFEHPVQSKPALTPTYARPCAVATPIYNPWSNIGYPDLVRELDRAIYHRKLSELEKELRI